MFSAYIHRPHFQSREAAFDLKTYIRPPANLEMDPPCSFTSRRLKKEASSSMSSDSVTGLHKRPQTIIELGAVSLIISV